MDAAFVDICLPGPDGLIAEIIHYGDRLYQLRLKDRRGTIVEVSRSAAHCLTHLLRPRL